MHSLEAAVKSQVSLATEDCKICFQFIHSLFDIYIYNLLPAITITLFDSLIFCKAIFSTLFSDAAAYCCCAIGLCLLHASNYKIVSVSFMSK